MARKKRTISRTTKRGIPLAREWALCLLGTAFLLASTIFQVNAMTETAWRLASQEKDAELLVEKTRLMESRASKAPTFEEMEEMAALLGFERVSNVAFLNAADTAVARRAP